MSKIKGYGYSIWLVPLNWQDIKRVYMMSHIPHITVHTGLDWVDSSILSENTFTVYNFSRVHKFPKMYTQDPLSASGFYCSVKDLKMLHSPHMTLKYSHENINFDIAPPETLMCKLCVADTQSLDCSQWRLL